MVEQRPKSRRRGVIGKIMIAFGILFIIIIILIITLIVIKPYGINLIKVIPALVSDNTSDTASAYDHPYLNEKQESLLEAAGVDVKNIPSEITSAQQQCSVSILGAERAYKIAGGETPTIAEILKIKDCFQ